MDNLELLDNILLSDNVVNLFHKYYSNVEFKNWLISILPEVEDCKNQQQDNPWHVHNCLNHILHSVEEMNKQTKDLPYDIKRMLSYTMFYHDLGKPACHIRRYSKLYGRQVDSFFNHNKVSTDIAKRTLSKFNFNKQDSKIIEQLVYKHDIFMFITLYNDNNPHHRVFSTDLLKEEINNFNSPNGNELMHYLILVGRSDNLAQNPNMTKNSLHLLNVMENTLNTLYLSNS